MAKIFDLAHPIDSEIPAYPGDPPYSFTVAMVATGKSVPNPIPNLSRIHLGLHVGTHGDAPFHFVPNGSPINEVDLNRCLGPACLIPLEHLSPQEEITPEHLEPHRDRILKCKRVLLRTGWDKRFHESNYFTHHPVISASAAQLLVDWGVLTVGMDFPSVDYSPYATHFILLENRVFIVENLTRLDPLPLDGFRFRFCHLP